MSASDTHMSKYPVYDAARPPVRLGWGDTRKLNKDRVGWMIRAAREQGGVARFKFWNYDIFFVADPDVIRELIVRRPDALHRDQFTSNVLRRIMGNGVFIAEDEAWQQQRKLVAPAFHAMRVRAYAETMAEYTREMVGRWSDGEARQLDKDLTQLTLRIIAKTMFNVDLVEETERLGRLMTVLLETGEAQLDSAYPPPNWVPTPVNRRQNKALGELHDVLRGIIRERQASGRDEGDLLSMLVQARDEDGRPMSEAQIVDECVTLVTAGHETTAVALMWAWLLLGQHPRETAMLYKEVDERLAGQPLTFDKLAELPYTEMVVKETLRLFPPAFSFGRAPVEDVAFELNGREYAFKKGATIIVSTMAMHRLPEYFPEPDAFRPERWAADEPQPPKYAYLPFGAGPRVCLGNMFAMMEAQVILATMAQRVRLAPEPGSSLEWDPVITLRPSGPVRMRVSIQ
jgi:cytochrome P450